MPLPDPVPPPDPHTAELVRRAQAGDRAAVEDLALRVEERLQKIVRRRLGPGLRQSLESSDVMQEVMFEALRALQGFQSRGKASFLRWIAGIVENRIRNEARRVQRYPVSLVSDETLAETHGPSGLVEVEHDDERERHEALLERGLSGLRERSRKALRLRRAGLGFEELGRELGCSNEAARRLHHRATVELVERVHRLRRSEARR